MRKVARLVSRGPAVGRRLFLFSLLALACGSGADVLKPDPDDDGGNGGIQRGSLTVAVVAEGAGARVANALGWSGARIPSASVTLQRVGQAQRVTQTADAQGQTAFTDLLPGFYVVSVARLLSEEEMDRLAGTADADVNSFGAGGSVEVKAGENTKTLTATAGSRGSIVFSEIFGATGYSQTESYRHAHYFEFYNNSDSTLYLDGRVIVQGFFPLHDDDDASCDTMAPYRLDPEAIYSVLHLQFPGSGREYALHPGQSALVAQDAIDHREFWPGMPDLRAADFESVGTTDVDNPAVPNMIDVSAQARWQAPSGHGMTIGGQTSYAVTVSLDVSTLELVQTPTYGNATHRRRFPRATIADLAMVLTPPEAHDIQFGALCSQFIHPSFDQAPATFFLSRNMETYRRKVLALLPDGQAILQRTGTSAEDFEVAVPSPFKVP